MVTDLTEKVISGKHHKMLHAGTYGRMLELPMAQITGPTKQFVEQREE